VLAYLFKNSSKNPLTTGDPVVNEVFFPFLLPFLLHLAAAFSFVCAVVLVIALYRETDKGWYWLGLVLSIILIAFSQWLMVVFPHGIGGPFLPVLSEASAILGSLLLTVSFYGMYKTMRDIRKRME